MLEIQRIWEKEFNEIPHWSLWLKYDEKLLAINPDKRFSGASMIKIFLLQLLIEDIDQGKKNWSDMLHHSSIYNAAGDGIIAGTPDTSISLAMAANLMFNVSDNVATNMIIEYLGGVVAVNDRWFRSYGDDVRLFAWVGGKDRDSRSIEWSPSSELPTQSSLSIVTVQACSQAMNILMGDASAAHLMGFQQDQRSLARHIDVTTEFYHKSGTADGLRHDGGILILPDGKSLEVYCLTDGPERDEYVDDVACKAMGRALAETIKFLGYEEVLVDQYQ